MTYSEKSYKIILDKCAVNRRMSYYRKELCTMSGKLKEIIDIGMLQRLLDGFAAATGMSCVAIDENGAVTKICEPSEFCRKYGAELVLGGNTSAEASAAALNTKSSVYRSKTGLTEICVPVSIKGIQYGAVVAGQILAEQLDEAAIKKLAAQLSTDEKRLAKELSEVPVLSKRKIDNASDFIYNIITVVSAASSADKQEIELDENAVISGKGGVLYKKITQIDKLLDDNKTLNKHLFENFNELKKSADDTVKHVKDTTDVVKSIQDVAMNTRILGFNASIEASRAKESGKGFGVIAQEVRSLAEVSNSSTNKISEIIGDIANDTEEIFTGLKSTETYINRSADNASAVSELLREIASIAKNI